MGEVIQLFKEQEVVDSASGEVEVAALTDAVASLEFDVSQLSEAVTSGTEADVWQWVAAVKRTASLLPGAPGDG